MPVLPYISELIVCMRQGKNSSLVSREHLWFVLYISAASIMGASMTARGRSVGSGEDEYPKNDG